MGLSCGAKMAKMLLFIFNAIFFLLGAAILAVGIWIVVDKDKLMELASTALGDDAQVINNQLSTQSTVLVGAYVLIGVGAFNFVVGFCGCCGACTENKCLLGIYAFLIGLIMILEIVGAILAGVFNKDVSSKLQVGLAKTLNSSFVGLPFSVNTTNPVSLAWDFVMITQKCCGLNGASDFKTAAQTNASKWYKEGRSVYGKTLLIPYACCKFKSTDFALKSEWGSFKSQLVDPNCGPSDSPGIFNNKGCYDAMREKVMRYAPILIGVAIAVVVVELLGIILACCLMRAMDSDARRQSA